MKSAQQLYTDWFSEPSRAESKFSQPFREGFLTKLISEESRNVSLPSVSCRYSEGTADYDAYYYGVQRASNFYEAAWLSHKTDLAVKGFLANQPTQLPSAFLPKGLL